MKKPRILLLFVGGTIAMEYQSDSSLSPGQGAKNFLDFIPELKDLFEIETVFIANVDSTNIQISHWERVATIIHAKYQDFDGFVVTHGTDTMSYTASALSFALKDLGKPVVLTGAQLPIIDLRSDARLNLINAFFVASMDLAEVVIVFGSRILRGNRSTKVSESNFTGFETPKYPTLGKIRTNIKLYNFHKKRDKNIKPDLQALYNDNIAIFTVQPGVNPKFLDCLIDNNASGIIITAVGAGNVPNATNSLVDSIRRAQTQGIPVVIVTQCSHGAVNMEVYETGSAALYAGAISGQDMTIEAATTKLMWVLGQTQNLAEIKTLMEQNLAGELSPATSNE